MQATSAVSCFYVTPCYNILASLCILRHLAFHFAQMGGSHLGNCAFPHSLSKVCKGFMSAAMGPGGLDYETLHRKLSLVRSYVDPKVLNQMIRFFAPQIPLADQQLLSQLYDTAKASPLTSTRASLRVNEGLVFNGAFAGGTPSRYGQSFSMYMVCRWPCCVHGPNAPQSSMTFSPSVLVLAGQCCSLRLKMA